ncbi:hypothetical protein Tco_0071926 [Tanacetum coccineum]
MEGANVGADSLSQKERIKPMRVRALVMTIGLNLPKHILNAQAEARKEENYITEYLNGAEVEHPEPGFELQGAKMVEMGRFG